MHQFRKLLWLLEKELSQQERLLGLLSKERVAIVKLQKSEIEKIAEQKEPVIREAAELAIKRLEVLRTIKTVPAGEHYRMDEFVECCPAELKTELTAISAELKQTAQAVRELNSNNAGLIRQSLSIIASTVAIMSSRPGTELPTYGQRGKLRSKEEDPAFSRRNLGVARSA